MLCFAATCCTFPWFAKFVISGRFSAYPGFVLTVALLLAVECVLMLDEYNNPIYAVGAINIWPSVFVIGWGTAAALLYHIVNGATYWLENGHSIETHFVDYLNALDIYLPENTTYLGWNKIAKIINGAPIIGAEILIVVACFILFFFLFLVTEWGRKKA